MFFEELKENYTKVLIHPKPSIIETVPEKSSFTKAAFIFGLTGICYFAIGSTDVFASDFNAKAEALYYDKFLGIAKWVIIGKGGWDTLNKAIKEDFDGAKKSFMQYMLIFATLLLLPVALNQVEEIVKG